MGRGIREYGTRHSATSRPPYSPFVVKYLEPQPPGPPVRLSYKILNRQVVNVDSVLVRQPLTAPAEDRIRGGKGREPAPGDAGPGRVKRWRQRLDATRGAARFRRAKG